MLYVEFNIVLMHFSDVLASQDQSGGDATVTIDQRKYLTKISDKGSKWSLRRKSNNYSAYLKKMQKALRCS